MGYNVMTIGGDVTIAADKLEPAFEALKALNKRDDLKTGGSYGALPDGTYGQTERWFAWMPVDYDKTAKDAREIFEMLGFNVEEDDKGLHISDYDDKSGAEDTFLEAVAPFVTAGSYLEWEGEDGEHWRQDFDGTTVTTRHGRIVYE
jgi:hypothetical protein